jgi:hypothetical protein
MEYRSAGFIKIGALVQKLKLKVKLSLCFNRAPRHEDVLGEWKYSSTPSLTPALDGSEMPAPRPGRFTPRERAPGTHLIGGLVGPRAVLEAVKRKIFSPRWDQKLIELIPIIHFQGLYCLIEGHAILIFLSNL